jgi:cell division septation protein DedD
MRLRMLAAVITWSVLAAAQTGAPDVQQLVDLVNRGQGDVVKAELPSLLSRYPNNPGILYVQALLTSEGAEAVRMYQSIVDNFPKSEWADDALYKVYQFYYSLGLYRTAELKMAQLKRDYPSSRYVTSGATAETSKLPEEAKKPKTQAAATPAAQQPKPAAAPQTPGETAVPQAGETGLFSLQVGAYTALTNADRQKKFFEEKGYTAEVISRVRDGRSMYVVLVGAYRTYDEAKARAGEIKQRLNIDSFVLSR